MKFGFCGPSYVAQSQIIDDEIAMNCYCEQSESPSAATVMALLHTPGRKKLATAPESSMPCGFTVNGRTFFAASNLYELNAAGQLTNWGSIGATPVTPTMLTANETQLVILNNGDLYVFTLATNTLVAVNMGQFNGPIAQIEFDDGYIIATLQNSHTFQQSNLEDATTWSGLNVSTISYFPDNVVSMKAMDRYLWLQSAKKSLAYYNSGAGFPVFIPVQGEMVEYGSGATFGTVEAADDLYWLEQNEGGFMVARSLREGRISTHAVEFAWQTYAKQFGNVANAVGWWYQDQGHTFIVWYFPSASATWVYDASESQATEIKLWHQRGYFVTQTGNYIADRAMTHTFNFNKHIVGDWASGNIYELSLSHTTDDGNPIRGNRRTPTIAKENQWLYFGQLEFVMETGLQTEFPIYEQDGVTLREPVIQLRWSNDGGKTWSNWYFLGVGFVGEYQKRVIKRMLGRARKRLWDVAWSDPYPYRFNEAFLQLEAEST